jgi:hypothetical protein
MLYKIKAINVRHRYFSFNEINHVYKNRFFTKLIKNLTPNIKKHGKKMYLNSLKQFLNPIMEIENDL